MSKKSEYTLTDLDGKVYTIPNRRNNKLYDMRTNASLVKANLAKEASGGINIAGINLQGCNVRGAYLFNADLKGANLRDADLRDANLSGADLSGTDLSGADLRGSDLQDANLRGSNLYGVKIGKSTVKNTNLEDSDITDAVLWYPKLQHITAKSIRESKKTVDSITRNILNNPNNECDEAISKLLMARITGIKGLASLFNNYGCDALKRLLLSFKASSRSCDSATMMFKKAVKDYINNIRVTSGLITKPNTRQKLAVYPDSSNISLFQTHKALLEGLIGSSWRNDNRQRLLNYFDKKVTSALSSIFTSSQIQSYIDGCLRVIQMKRDYARFHDMAAIANPNYYRSPGTEWYLSSGEYMLNDDDASLNLVKNYICDHAEEFQPYDIIFMGSSYESRQEYGFYILVKTCLDSIELMSIGEGWFYNLETLNIREPTSEAMSGYSDEFGERLKPEYLESLEGNINTQRKARVDDFVGFLVDSHIVIPTEIMGETKNLNVLPHPRYLLDPRAYHRNDRVRHVSGGERAQRLTNFFEPALNSACVFLSSKYRQDGSIEDESNSQFTAVHEELRDLIFGSRDTSLRWP